MLVTRVSVPIENQFFSGREVSKNTSVSFPSEPNTPKRKNLNGRAKAFVIEEPKFPELEKVLARSYCPSKFHDQPAQTREEILRRKLEHEKMLNQLLKSDPENIENRLYLADVYLYLANADDHLDSYFLKCCHICQEIERTHYFTPLLHQIKFNIQLFKKLSFSDLGGICNALLNLRRAIEIGNHQTSINILKIFIQHVPEKWRLMARDGQLDAETFADFMGIFNATLNEDPEKFDLFEEVQFRPEQLTQAPAHLVRKYKSLKPRKVKRESPGNLNEEFLQKKNREIRDQKEQVIIFPGPRASLKPLSANLGVPGPAPAPGPAAAAAMAAAHVASPALPASAQLGAGAGAGAGAVSDSPAKLESMRTRVRTAAKSASKAKGAGQRVLQPRASKEETEGVPHPRPINFMHLRDEAARKARIAALETQLRSGPFRAEPKANRNQAVASTGAGGVSASAQTEEIEIPNGKYLYIDNNFYVSASYMREIYKKGATYYIVVDGNKIEPKIETDENYKNCESVIKFEAQLAKREAAIEAQAAQLTPDRIMEVEIIAGEYVYFRGHLFVSRSYAKTLNSGKFNRYYVIKDGKKIPFTTILSMEDSMFDQMKEQTNEVLQLINKMRETYPDL